MWAMISCNKARPDGEIAEFTLRLLDRERDARRAIRTPSTVADGVRRVT